MTPDTLKLIADHAEQLVTDATIARALQMQGREDKAKTRTLQAVCDRLDRLAALAGELERRNQQNTESVG